MNTETVKGQICRSVISESKIPLCNTFTEKYSVETSIENSMIVPGLFRLEIDDDSIFKLLNSSKNADDLGYSLSPNENIALDQLKTLMRISVANFFKIENVIKIKNFSLNLAHCLVFRINWNLFEIYRSSIY